jgi:hypothetical protein
MPGDNTGRNVSLMLPGIGSERVRLAPAVAAGAGKKNTPPNTSDEHRASSQPALRAAPPSGEARAAFDIAAGSVAAMAVIS